jgi:hypothetical protein
MKDKRGGIYMKAFGKATKGIDSMREILPVQGRIQEILTRFTMVEWLLTEVTTSTQVQGW